MSIDSEIRNPKSEIEELELRLFLEAIFAATGCDFRDYAPASLRRRLWNVARAEDLGSISMLQGRVLHDPEAMRRLLLALSVNVTSMFRDPAFFQVFRASVTPQLRTYPLIRLWCAGCSTGEEVYSLAILLKEEGLYDRCRLYATDMNEAVIEKARDGIFPLADMKEYTGNYQRAGGVRAFSDYYTAAYERAQMDPALKQRIVFAQHNLATDHLLNEFQVILCRNVMIYFNDALQTHVHNLLYDSLCNFGFLGLGRRENLRFTPHEADYEAVQETEKMYRRKW